ncbi:MAG: hypothetical protein A2018_00240 [Alphaproteobacteria bacterium GWF2_58_20]|nr:MAG: hypothetical protein A2018_00240 [Alphaproteobacteria bacterium GWF2_58_20]
MQGIEIYDIIILALAAFLGWRLFSVLGQQGGDEDVFGSDDTKAVKDSAMPAAIRRIHKPAPLSQDLAPELREGIDDILKEDPAFDLNRFVAGARQAYAMVVEAFSMGDVATLKPLLGDEVYEAFAAAIQERGGDMNRINVAEILEASPLEARCDGREAMVTVRFRSRQVHARGEGLETLEATDIWTFRRLVRNPDPNWMIVEAREDT